MVRRTHYLKLIRPFIGTDVIKVITGIRRCGKSVLLEQIRDEIVSKSPKTKIVYLDLEDKANAHFLRGNELFSTRFMTQKDGRRRSTRSERGRERTCTSPVRIQRCCRENLQPI